MSTERREPTAEDRAAVGRWVMVVVLVAMAVIIAITYRGVLPWQEVAAVVAVSALVGAVVQGLLRTRQLAVVLPPAAVLGGLLLLAAVDRREWIPLYFIAFFGGFGLAPFRRRRTAAS